MVSGFGKPSYSRFLLKHILFPLVLLSFLLFFYFSTGCTNHFACIATIFIPFLPPILPPSAPLSVLPMCDGNDSRKKMEGSQGEKEDDDGSLVSLSLSHSLSWGHCTEGCV